MAKKKAPALMPVDEIRRLASLTDEELEASVSVASLRKALNSFTTVDKVAVAAWKLMKGMQTGTIPTETVAELQDALSEYSPANFTSASYTAAVTCAKLESVYDRIASCDCPAEELFTVINELRKEAGF